MSDLAAKLERLSPEKRELLLRELARRKRPGRAGGEAPDASEATLPEDPPAQERAGPCTGAGDHPLSWAQERLWFLDRLEGAGALYVMPGAFRLRGPVDEAALAGAFEDLQRRHAVLRATFPEVDGGPVQRIALVRAGRKPEPLPTLDATALAGRAPERARRLVNELVRAESRRPFDLDAGPLVRVLLVRLGPEHRVLSLVLHHIIADGWSMRILVRDLAAFYDARRRGVPAPLGELPLQYPEHAARERERLSGGVLEEHLAYWRDVLAGAPAALDLPGDRPRPPVRSPRGGRRPLGLGEELSGALRALAREEGGSLFMGLLAAFALLLHRLTGATDLVVGTPIANRDRRETEGMVGLLLNTLALRIDLSGEPGFRELVRRVRRTALGAFDHAELPFERLVEALQPERSLHRTPIFQVMLVLQGAPVEAAEAGEIAIEPLGASSGIAKFDLMLDLGERGGDVRGSLEYSSDLFDAATAGRFARAFGTLLLDAVAAPERSIAELSALALPERHQLLVEWSSTGDSAWSPALPPGPAQTLYGMFAAQVARSPDAPAVAGAFSYRELDERTRRIARELRRLGVGPERRVGVCLPRTPELVAALLGVLGAGGAYVPLDPAYPAERTDGILGDAGVQVVLTSRELAGRIVPAGGDVPRLLLLEDLEELTAGGGVPPATPAGGAALSHVIYTSGSTGRPKGVAIPVSAAVAMLAWARSVFPEAAGPVLATTSICFDLSVFELFLPLASGGTVVLADDALDAPRQAAEHPVRLVNTVPSAMAELIRAGELPPAVTTVNLAGEALRRELVDSVYRQSTVSRVVNLYGPSEDTTYSTWAEVPRQGDGEPTIGRPVGGTRAYVLGADARPVPAGVPGELVLAGAGLARGYLGRPAATSERFVPEPPAGPGAAPGGRAYRTGDLVRHRGDGELLFLGRLDHQVKLRGFRVEPGEIEACLAVHPAVGDVAVVVREDRPGDPALVAYAVPTPEAERAGELATPAVRELLAQRLPDYMLPAALVVLDELPRTPNGKVDRKRLAGPEHAPERPASAGRAALRSGTEELLAALWREVLGVETVGAGDDFFALGGQSLLATRLASRVRSVFGVELAVREVFRHPTLGALARALEGTAPGAAGPAPPIRRLPRPASGPARFPLSFAQERLWFLDRLEPGGSAYNIPTALWLRGDLDVQAFLRAFSALVRRHEALRTVFTGGRETPVQVIRPPGTGTAVPFVDLSGLPGAAAPGAARRWARVEARRPFDLEAGPLVRCRLVRVAPREHLLVLVLHHAVADGWSLGILAGDLEALYRHHLRGGAGAAPALPEPAVQYGDFAAWQREWLRGEPLDRLLAFWTEALGPGPHVLDLPTDRPRPAVQSYRGGRRSRRLAPELTAGLRELSRRRGATDFMTSLALFAVLAHRMTGDRAVSVGSPVANRTREETEPLVGLFVNTLVLRTELGGDPSFLDLLGRVRSTTLEAFAHQDLPFEKLVEEVEPQRSLAHAPLFQVLFVFQNTPDPGLELPGIEAVAAEETSTGATKFDLTLELREIRGRLAVALEHNLDLFDASTAERILARYETLAAGVVEDPGRRISELPAMAPAELHQVIREWNDTVSPGHPAELLHQPILDRARRAPEAPAVAGPAGPLTGCERLSAGELAAWAGRLAARLRAEGVGPETPVGVCLARTADLPVALLGVLAAGGAYVPLDPAYPAERIELMLRDSGAPLVLTERAVAERVPAAAVRTLVLDAERQAIAALPGEAPPAPVVPENLAYVIYTSGSTGRPKGVAIVHRAAAALVGWARGVFPEAAGGSVLAATSICFDLSVFEIFLPLAAGGAVAVAPSAVHLPEAAAAARPEDPPLRLINTVPSVMAELVRGSSLPDAVETVNLAGEPLARELVEEIYSTGAVRRVLNLYGPSEDTTYSTWTAVASAPKGSPPGIGRPVAGTRAYLLDPAPGSGVPVPHGVPGELHLGGAGLARGYLGRPGPTAERFVPDPFAGRPGGRLYRTGDLARHRGDGNLDFLGRLDHQVKLRGFRIEPGEVEEALRGHPAVADAAAAVRGAGGASGSAAERRLVAYAVPADGADGLDPGQLTAWLARKLPAYMVPAAVLVLDALPLTPNGKVDRRALPAPEDWGAGPAAEYEPPRTATERTLARIWEDVLGVERAGVHDNFFDLGGHSLLMVRVHHRIQSELERELPLVATFAHPTVAALAAHLDGGSASGRARESGQTRGEQRRRAQEARRRRAGGGRR